MLDKGEHLPIDEVREAIDAERLFIYLGDRFPTDFSLYKDEDRRAVHAVFQSLSDPNHNRKKFFVERDGLALIVACCIEVLQHPDDYESV